MTSHPESPFGSSNVLRSTIDENGIGNQSRALLTVIQVTCHDACYVAAVSAPRNCAQKIEEDAAIIYSLAHQDATPAPTVRFTGGFCCAVSVGTHDYNYRASPSVSDHVLR